MTKEDKRRMHMGRPAMCGIQNSSIFAHPPTPRAPALRPRLMLLILQEEMTEQDVSWSCLQAFLLPQTLMGRVSELSLTYPIPYLCPKGDSIPNA